VALIEILHQHVAQGNRHVPSINDDAVNDGSSGTFA